MRIRSLIIGLLLATPPLAASGLLAYVAGAEIAGRTPFSEGPPRNGAEAAGVADGAAVMQFLRRGESPFKVHVVRPNIISSAVQRATTPEAAVWSPRADDLIRLLDREGVLGDAATRARTACLAKDLDRASVADYLMPAGTACLPGEALAGVLARTQ